MSEPRNFEEWVRTEAAEIGLSERELQVARLAWNRAVIASNERHASDLARLLEHTT